MTLRELKNWINKLPEEFLEYSVMNGEFGMIDEEYHYRVDKPITTLTVDEETKEVVFLNDTYDEIKKDK
jgi:hypothetical protein